MPDTYYKFKPFSEYLIKELCNGEVYYAPPASFNDPLDCSPEIIQDVHGKILNELYLKIVSERYGREKALYMFNENKYMAEDREGVCTYQECFENILYNDILRAFKDHFCNYGVLSLTKKFNSPLMWSHYADQHRGVCIGYELHDPSGMKPEKVDYSAQRGISAEIILDWLNGDTSLLDGIKGKYFLAKANDWKYEKEWRCISESNGTNFCPFKISSILFGMRCDSSIVSTIVKLMSSSADTISYFQVKPKDGQFRLIKIPMDTGEIMASTPRQSPLLAFEPFPS
jgi:hypothetical protein